MKKSILFLLLVIYCANAYGQHTIRLVRIWQKPQIHLVYHQYHLYFTIKDINTTIRYLHEIDPKVYPDTISYLKENMLYATELSEGRDMEYLNRLQPILQQEAGAFMLMRGHAYIETSKHKKVKVILAEAGPPENHSNNSFSLIHFYDAKTHQELFAGMMNLALMHRYLELQ